ncbi:YadA-like family protein [Actinobacillus equuli]|uniref:YadA-like family protein n=1 Tax=Actinobacillus equuli TaxID=718 RepID=UPI0024423072|nr:YadA-like family protein [Actinobacillus equuli]WGE47499.1 YadA-like family protein [Actinobacillus equuli subsp. haemolyticus]
MNKIFKVIWNHTTQTFVVTSELSKSKAKSSSTDERVNTKNLLALSALGSVVLGSALIPTMAEAAVAIGSASTAGAYAAAISGDAAVNYNNPGSLSYDNPNRTRTGSNLYSPRDNIGDVESTGIAIGNQSSALAANYPNLASGIAIGDYAKASGPLSTALGHFSIASGTGAMAQGTASRASGFNSLSMMRQSAATSAYAMAIGTASWADGVSSLAVGQSATSKGKQSIAIGSADVAATATTDGRGGIAYASSYSTNHTDSSGDYSIAIGTIAKSGAANSTAIGYNANATGGSSFALGVNSRTEKDNSIAIGNQSKALNADTIAVGRQSVANASSAMAFGLQANSSGVSSIAIGESANVATTGVSAIALGTRANAGNDGAVAIGLHANAAEDQAIAIGEHTKATANDTVAIGSTTNATERDAIAIGTNNNVTACYSVAIGSNNKVAKQETYVLGTNVNATQENSVILGSQSEDRPATTETEATINGITYGNFAGKGLSGNGVVSIGKANSERQLINVAAGKVSETSTDAINGSQLYAVANKLSEGWVIANGTKVGDVKLNNQVNFLAGNANTNVEVKANGTTGIYDVVISALNTASTAAGIEYYSVNSTVANNKDNKGATASNAMAAGPKASATGNESIAIGYNSTASSVSATAMGDSSLASGGLSTAIGTSATSTGLAATSIGVLAKATADGANAMGFEATASNNNTVAVGTSSLASGPESTALGYNSTASAQNTVALGSDSIANATSALAVGVGATATADSAVAIGNDSNATGKSSVAIGESSNATGTYATAVGDTSTATGDRSVAFGIDAKARNTSTVAIGDNATATLDNSVALGSGATTEVAVNTDSATVNGITYSGFAGNTAYSVVSVGNGNQKRQIQNVAAGRISATSTDAINGSQLYVVANNLTDAINIANNTANAANVTANKGWNITTAKTGTGNVAGTLVDNIQLGETVTVEAGDNINITQSANKISIATSATPTFTTVTTQNFTAKPNGNINMGGNVVTNVAAPVNDTDAANKQYVDNGRTKVKSDNNSVKVVYDQASNTYDLAVDVVPTVNLQDGKNTKVNNTGTTYSIDAWNTTAKAGSTEVNVTSEVNSTTNTIDYTIDLSDSAKNNITAANSVANQANTTANTALQTVVTQIDGADVKTITKDSNKANFITGDNIVLTADNEGIKISTSKTPTFTNVTAGDTKIDTDGVTINNGPSMTKDGINAGDKVISNVAAGTKPTDAVNVKQLTDNVTNVTNNINNVSNEVAKGWNITTSASEGSVMGNSTEQINMGELVTIDAGKNINITQTAGKISIATSDKPTFSNVTVGDTKINNDGVTINNGPSVTKNGIDAANTIISNVKDGKVEAGSKEVVNGGQLFNATTNLTNAGLNFVGNNVSGVIHKNLSQTLAIVGELANTATASAKNVRVDTENGKLVIKLSENPTFTTVTTGNTTLDDKGLTIKDGPSITNNGIDAGNKQIINVAEGTKGTDAVNLDQLNKAVATTKTELVDGNTTTVTTTQDPNGKTTYQVEVNKAPVTINSKTGVAETPTKGDNANNSFATVGDVVNALNNVSWTIQGNNADKDKVTAGNQVNFVNGAGTTADVTSNGTQTNVTFNVNKSGLTVNNGKVTANQPGDTFATAEDVAKAITDSELTSTVVSGNNNLVVTNTTTGNNTEFKVTLSNNLDLTDKGSVKIGNTTLNNDGLTVGNTSVTADGVKVGNVTINNDGIDAGGNKITNVANGTNATDAVNVSQLDAKTAAAKTELANGNTTTVTPKTGDNGQTIYTVEVNKAPVTINSTTGVAETSATGDKANNSFATVGDVVNALNNVSWTIQGNGADKDKVTAGNKVNFVNGTGTTADVTSNGTKTDVTFNVNKSGLTVNKDGNGNVTVKANTAGDTFATADEVAKAITDSELTSTVVAGNKNLNVTSSTKGNNTEFNVTLSNNLDLTDKGSLTIGNVTVKADGINAGDNKVTGVADGDISPASTQAVNGSQLYAANQNIANYLGGNSTVDDKGNVTAPTYTITKTDGSTATVNNVGEALNNLNNEVVKPLTFAGDTGTASERKLGSTVTVKGGVTDEAKLADNNIGVVSDGNGTLTVKLAKDLNIDSVTAKEVTANTVKAGDTTIDSDGVKITNGPSVTKSGIDAAGNKITNVKAGEADTDAVNVSQLKAATGNVHNRINKVNKQLRAGIAGANAAAGLPQVYVPGKSMVAAAAGTFKGESALAVGYSRSSDNGKVILKLQGNANTRGDLGGSVGVGYQW